MKFVSPLLLGSLVLTLLGTSAVSAEKTVDKAAVTTKELMYSVIDKSDYAISFKRGSAVVDQSSQNSLKALLQSLKGEMTGAEVVIGSWSDKEFPLNSEVKLTNDDAKLATARAENVEKLVKKLGVNNTVQVINFGEQNTLLSQLFKFGSDAPEVKDAIQNGATDSRKVAAVAKKMQDMGGASKVVLLVRRESKKDENNM